MHAKQKSTRLAKRRASRNRARHRIRRASYYRKKQNDASIKYYLASAVRLARSNRKNLSTTIRDKQSKVDDAPEQLAVIPIKDDTFVIVTRAEQKIFIINITKNYYYFLNCKSACNVNGVYRVPYRIFYLHHKTPQCVYLLMDFFSHDERAPQKIFLGLLDIANERWIFQKDVTEILSPYWSTGSQVSTFKKWFYISGGVLRSNTVSQWFLDNTDNMILDYTSVLPNVRLYGHVEAVAQYDNIIYLAGGADNIQYVPVIRLHINKTSGNFDSVDIMHFQKGNFTLPYLLWNKNCIYAVNAKWLFLYCDRTIFIFNFQNYRIQYYIHTILWSAIRLFVKDKDQCSLYEFAHRRFHKNTLTNLVPWSKERCLWLAYKETSLSMLGSDITRYISTFLTSKLTYKTH